MAFVGASSAAHAATMQVNYTASSGAGAPIVIGLSPTPQYSFVLGTFFNGAAQYKIQGNDGSLVSFPDNGIQQPKLPAVTTRLGDITFTEGDYQLFFNIGSLAYTGFATVGDQGRLISAITFNPTTAVPEPATWTLMLAGIGLATIALRRHRWIG